MKPKRTRRIVGLVLAAALAAGMAGCKATKPKGQAQNSYVGGEGREMEARIGNRGLERDLKILRPLSERRDGRLHVQFELHNQKTRDLAFEYAIVWRDEAGFVIDTPWHWTPMSIVGQGYRTISITAPTPEASQWELNVQPPSSVR